MLEEPADSGWLDERAAQGMYLLVKEALEMPPEDVPPFKSFLDMMEYIDVHRGTLLDVGCGVGGYAALVDRYHPGIEYRGCDISPHMIELAQRNFVPLGILKKRFFVHDALDLQYGADIILASSLIEVCPNWREVLRHLCALQFRWFILSRVRLWNDPGHPTTEQIYTTLYKTRSLEVIHRHTDLLRLIADAGCVNTHTIVYQKEPETQLVCMLLEKE